MAKKPGYNPRRGLIVEVCGTAAAAKWLSSKDGCGRWAARHSAPGRCIHVFCMREGAFAIGLGPTSPRLEGGVSMPIFL